MLCGMHTANSLFCLPAEARPIRWLRHKLTPLSALLVSCLLLSTALAAAEPVGLLNNFSRSQLLVVSDQRPMCRFFNIYLAVTPAQKARGLMHIESLEWHEGMLFLYPEPGEITMWMKNTLIPLDMLFIDAQRNIIRIEAETVPHSEALISSRGPAQAVLELRGGAAARFGIQHGDRIIYPAG